MSERQRISSGPGPPRIKRVVGSLLAGCTLLLPYSDANGADAVSSSRATRRIVERFDARLPVEIDGAGAALLKRRATVFDLREPDLAIDGRAEWRFFGIENELGDGPGDEFQPLRQRFDAARRQAMPANLLVPRGCGIATILPLRADAAAPQARLDRSLGPLQIVARGTFIGWTELTIDIAALDLEEQALPIHLKRGELRALLAEHRIGNLRLRSDPDGRAARGSFAPPANTRSLLALVRSERDWQGTLERVDIWRSGEFERRVYFGEIGPEGCAIVEADDTARSARFLPARSSLTTTQPLALPAHSVLAFHAGCVDAARIDLEVEALTDGSPPVSVFRESLDAASWLATDREVRIDLSAFANRNVRFKIHSRSNETGSRGVALLIDPRIEGDADPNAAQLTDSLLFVVDDLSSAALEPTTDPCATGRILRSLVGRFGAQRAPRDAPFPQGAIEIDSAILLDLPGGSSRSGLPFAAEFAAAGGRVIAIIDEAPDLLGFGCDEIVRVDPARDSGAFERALERIARRCELPLYVFVRSRGLRTGATRGGVLARLQPTEPEGRIESVDAAFGDVLRAWIDRGRFDRSRVALLALARGEGNPILAQIDP